MTISELPQTLRLEAIPQAGFEVRIDPPPAALDALARRMGIPAVLSFCCRFTLRRVGGRKVMADGHLRAAVVLTCVITLDSFESVIDESFEVCFVPVAELQDMPDPDSIDEIPYEDGVLAIGEAAAEQFALSLPQFPRRPGAELSEDSLLSPGDDRVAEVAVTPFAALAARRKPV